ncbi:MAG: cysteine--tRNA ligase [Saprospiraceae bacterium]|jgi:cysteinyl-tRNA synthetase|uniref:cysteine--tRNA ligase n=1 Tax=Candidatus Brachybacter algidus TaxID=2982024 RepID=UPI001B78F7C9|nr:cysteine--tRNA ligase [Candidatus Brachybacter algidus]MBP7305481.1 cysteine--tRNA ligase [Saprospiraceae bacterium]MBK6448462.1 cysteine--tRNA ligase [Candidatus Brachybacter algidus]MBK7603955.1 cysteine--tRNA ligase [Candidatus Brachybacter algidus]MBK8354052.1 cysteine--tRNA ligase [Candidatus Brachybacter algidus]MBK8605055.1 cysteine--tRNA ligase [Candidatus Brachybacter algidus]
MSIRPLYIFNTLKGEKELFVPIVESRVGMYVCGPTVYSDVHLGNCRTFVSFDVIYRYLLHLGYKVRYVRNITDVGHLVGDVDTGAEDKIGKKARTEAVEPMEIVQRYSNGFHDIMKLFNTLEPSIEPSATGHIIEQIQMVQDIMDNGLAYEMNGSVYFDTLKYAEETGQYGKLSGRIIDDLITESRDDLKNQSEKKHPSDFALWIKADESHLMRWPSKWSIGFPGWHLECSAMSTKYLGKTFDIHGGGQDLKFPHHENEIAQNFGASGCNPAKYWMHGNMLLMNGKKMSKSDGNSILPYELISGQNDIFPEAFSPMAIRFFMAQSNYRSTLDITYDALKAAQKGFTRIREAYQLIDKLSFQAGNEDIKINLDIKGEIEAMYEDMSNDFNTPKTIARLYELVSIINIYYNNPTTADGLNEASIELLRNTFDTFLGDIMGIQIKENTTISQDNHTDGLMEVILTLRAQARENKDWTSSDLIRDKLGAMNIQVKDGKEGVTWSVVK